MDKNFSKQFTKCPCCGSESRFLEEMAKELKERGLAREEWSFHYDIRQGAVVDRAKEASMPIGSEVPGFGITTEICVNCGCVYAIDITRIDKKKTVVPSPQMPPNRAARRRLEKEGGGFFNNPATS